MIALALVLGSTIPKPPAVEVDTGALIVEVATVFTVVTAALLLALRIGWRVAKPHVVGLIRSVQDVQYHVQPNGGGSAYDQLREELAEVGRTAQRAEDGVDAMRKDFGRHELRSRQYLERARASLALQGVHLPEGD